MTTTNTPAIATAGLSAQEAQERLRRYGPNTVPEERPPPLLLFLHKFWSPVPWMLEATLLLELALGKYTQAVIIAVLLVLNAVLSFLQERRAGNALQLLRQHLTVQARVLRDGRWQLVLAQDLVPGDVVHVRMGDLAPADVLLRDGQILVDQSALTGESAPVEVGPGNTAFAGSTVRRGEATGEVATTGPHTRFGKTAELVRTSRTPSHLEALIFTVVKYLVALDVVLVVAILVYAVVGTIPLAEIIPFALILLVASVPVALPATYTLASALGSLGVCGAGGRRGGRRATSGPGSGLPPTGGGRVHWAGLQGPDAGCPWTIPGHCHSRCGAKPHRQPHRPGNARAAWPAPTAPGQRGGQGDPWGFGAGAGPSLANKVNRDDSDEWGTENGSGHEGSGCPR